MGVFDDLAAQFDPVNKKRKGTQFELVCKWFLENDPNYKPQLRRVWLWDEWPGRKGIDAGIDLVAEDYDRNLWAIQAKAYGPANSISRHDINKFVAEASRKKFAYRVLIGTTDKRHHLATELMDELGIPFIGLTQLREADAYLDWPATPAALRPAKPLKPKKPWGYQKLAITDVVNGFKTAPRGQLIMACGTGKTLVAWFIKEKMDAERTLVLVPSLSLMKQTMTEWRLANPNKPFAALPVCSDETVGSLGADAAVSHTSDLGVPVTTDKNVIAEFLRKRSGPRVVFSTYQSSPQVAEAFKLGYVPAFDLVIADEAHRVAGSTNSEYGTILDAAKIKAKKRLFMTATPRYYTGRVLRAAKEVDYEMASMDDPKRFGTVFHRLTFAQAIEQDLLTDYRVAIIGVDNATYRDWAERGELITLDGKTINDARCVAGQIGLAKAMRKFDMRRVITFHSRVKAAKDFAKSMPTIVEWMPTRQRPKGRLWSQYASGEMSTKDRDQLIQQLKRLDDADRGLLANARCLSEGVDVPSLDGVAFIDPKQSEVDIVQAVGRAIRKSDSKTLGTIVIPVFIDTDEGDPDAALDSSVFKPVWDVVKALRAHDTELGEYLDALRRQMGRRKGSALSLSDKIYVDLPSIGGDFARAFKVHLVDATTASWEFWYGLLQKLVSEQGHSRIAAAENQLGRWITRQRSLRNNHSLSQERERLLEELPGWTWDPLVDKWEEGFSRLQKYIEDCGNSQAPHGLSVDGYPLGFWVATQRRFHEQGQLEPERERRLESLSHWTWSPHKDAWELGFSRLSRYIKSHGHSRVPKSYRDDDGYGLGLWVSNKRAKRANLTREQECRLDELEGWTWDPFTEQWELGFRHLQKYVEHHGDALVPQSYKDEDGYGLGDWVGAQRAALAWKKLSKDRQRRLEDLPGWVWDMTSYRWEKAFQYLCEYVERNGDARVPRLYTVDGFRLGGWLSNIRSRRDKVTEKNRRRLEGLRGWTWDAVADKGRRIKPL